MKYLFLFITLTFAFAANANAHGESNLQNTVDSLENRVKKLEHDLEYLRLTNDLDILRNSLNIAASEASIMALEIRVSRNHGTRSDIDKYISCQKYYDVASINLESSLGLLNAQKELVGEKLLDCDFTESEKDLLVKACYALEISYNTNVQALKLVKIALEIWKDMFEAGEM